MSTRTEDGSALVPNNLGENDDQPRAMFLLNMLPLESENEFRENVEIARKLTVTYRPAFRAIFDTPLHYAGKVEKIFINFGAEGIYELDARAEDLRNVGEEHFENHLRILLAEGRLFKITANNRIEVGRRIENIASLFSAIPENYVKIGCFSGPATQNFTFMTDFISSADADKSFLIAVGDFANSEIAGHLDQIVRVSAYELAPTYTLTRAVNTLIDKWKIPFPMPSTPFR